MRIKVKETRRYKDVQKNIFCFSFNHFAFVRRLPQ